MCSTVRPPRRLSLTVSLGPLSSRFCWTALALSPSLSSAPAELCPPHLPSSRRRTRPWTPRLQRSPSRSWTTNCYSLSQTPHLKMKTDLVAQTAVVQLTWTTLSPKDGFLYFKPFCSLCSNFWGMNFKMFLRSKRLSSWRMTASKENFVVSI